MIASSASATSFRDDSRYVARGPRTELRITGTEVSRRQRRELEQAWSDGVFDPFRLSEMRGILAYDLVRRNLIGARVEATVSETPDAGKVITLAVQGGQQLFITPVGAAPVTYAEVTRACAAKGHVAIGVRRSGKLELNARGDVSLEKGDQVVTIGAVGLELA